MFLAVSDGDICLTITDDGAGFDLKTAELGRGYGLPNIKDRGGALGRSPPHHQLSGRGDHSGHQSPGAGSNGLAASGVTYNGQKAVLPIAESRRSIWQPIPNLRS